MAMWLSGLPVLILTGYADPDVFGSQPFLAEPFATDELVERITALARSS